MNYTHHFSSPHGRSRTWWRPSHRGWYRRPYGRSVKKTPQNDYQQYISEPSSDVSPLETYQATKTFHDFPLRPGILRNIDRKGYTHPTEIQIKTLEAILDKHDVLGLANTWSGKTAAFLIPVIHTMFVDKGKTLILVPTRELAEQVHKEFQWISHSSWLRATIVVGGTSIGRQIAEIKRGTHCLIATPGRLKDLYERGVIDFSQYHHLVLDEFDRMLDMGFINDIRTIVSLLPQERQNLLFSATMSRDIEKHVANILVDPVRVEIKTEPVGSRIAQDVIFFTTPANHREKIHTLLATIPEAKILIFTKTKIGADRLSDDLRKNGFLVDALHGDKSQPVRSKITRKFRENHIKILIATDVAARGLDIPDVTHVINYDEPATREDYIHRIGRTARAGKIGHAYTFVQAGEK